MKSRNKGLIITSIAALVIALVLMLVCTIDAIRIKNFPESKYSLEYKITEFQGQVDTTYVLIPKK